MRLPLTAVFLLLAPALAVAGSWHCRNPDLEVSCSPSRCEARDAFTPVDVRLQDGGRMSVCAYSACFEGRSRVLRSGQHAFHMGERLARQPAGEAESFVVAVDTKARTGFIQGGPFAMPLRCERR